MGNHYDKLLKDPSFCPIKEKFTKPELIMLIKIFEDLASRDDGVIDKETFLLFFHFTGLWGERIFTYFDKKHTARIDFKEFLQGLATCCKCDQERKIQFLFNLYDLDQDGYIEKKEMITMLYNYPKNEIKTIIEDFATDKGAKLKSLREASPLIDSGLLLSPINFNPPSKGGNSFIGETLVFGRSPQNNMLSQLKIPKTILNDENKSPFDEEIPSERPQEVSTNTTDRGILVRPMDMNLPIIKISQPLGESSISNENSNPLNINIQIQPQAYKPSNVNPSIILTQNGMPNGLYMNKNPNTLTQQYLDPKNSLQSRKKIDSKLMIPKSSSRLRDQSFLVSTNVSGRVKDYASFLFRSYEGASARGKISYDEFKDWLLKHPVILRIFDSSFHQDIWGIIDDVNSEYIPHALKKNELPLRYLLKKADISGELLKKGKKFKMWKTRYFELKDHFLFYFKNINDYPEGILFLDGCQIEETKDYNTTKKYGFTINYKSDSYPPHTFYCNTLNQFNQWMQYLRCFQVIPIFEKYSFAEKIGTGKFSIVYRSIEKANNKEYAIKVIDKINLKNDEKELILMETSIMKILDHPHIIKLHETIETKSHYYIITDIVKDGDLFDYIVEKEFLEEIEASLVMYQLIQAFIYIHNAGIIHRDVKPENILINLGSNKMIKEIKIIDFGFAKYIQPNQVLYDTCGTPNYVAPEILSGKGYDKRADIWSIGILLYLMLRGQLPFDANDLDTILWKTRKGEISINDYHWDNISPEGKDLMMRFLQLDPSQRIELPEVLNHPWIKQRNIILPLYIGKNQRGMDISEESSADYNLRS